MIMKLKCGADVLMATESTKLSAHSKLIYIKSWMLAKERRRWFVGPDQKVLGEQVGASVRTTYRSTAQLRDLGLLRIRRKYYSGKLVGFTTYYWLA